MWHEARKQEKKIRCMLVDYQRRAQRRKDYYDKIRADPTQFLQLHGRPCKIHLDPAICIAANSSATMMPWQGNSAVMIDRFDVRAHLDYIPDVNSQNSEPENLSYEERQINYERYRILVQNDFFNIAEDKFLHQIHLEEKFGPVLKNSEDLNSSKKRSCAAIGYNYDDDDGCVATSSGSSKLEDNSKSNPVIPGLNLDANDDDDEEEDSESDIDLDLTVDVSKIETQQAHELNSCAHPYGMLTNDFFSFLNNDLEEAENMRIAKEQEEEKAMFSGRKSRKERRAFRERTLVGRKLSPPSYAWRKSPSYEDYKALVSSNRSRSRSSSPVNSGKITYITSFGGDEPVASTSTLSKSNSSLIPINQKDPIRKRTWSRSRSREKDKRSRRSRSASVDHRRKSARRFSSSSSRSRSRSRGRTNSSKFLSRFDKRTKRRSSSRSRSRSAHKTGITAVDLLKTAQDNVPIVEPNPINNPEVVTIPRYYGRRKDESSSELTLSSDDDSSKQSESSKNKTTEVPGPARSNTSIKSTSSDSKLTPQERLRRKRQVLLNKQFKADKRAERKKVMKMVQERIDRAEEMKEISIKLRRRQRMLRHSDGSPRRHSSRSRSSSSVNRSTSRSPYNKRSHRRGERCRSSSASSDSGDSSKNDRRRSYKKYDGSDSRSRSRSRSPIRSRSRNRSKSPHKSRYNEERDSKRSDRSKGNREHDKTTRSRRYSGHSEEREMVHAQIDNRIDSAVVRDDYRSRKDRSPKYGHWNEGCNERRERAYESDRFRNNNRSRFSRRSSSRDRHFPQYD